MTALRPLHAFMFIVGLLVLRAKAQNPQVTLPGATPTQVTGIYVPFNESEFLNVDTTFEVFLGIPFAEPPTGDLRFKKPVKKGDLGSSYSADSDKSRCPQGSEISDPDEDCLYLGVFSSSPRPINAPVLVWIHGGAYTGGAGSDFTYRPYSLLALSPDIVYVTINYRLGVFGFLTTGDSASPGNYGMFDQVMALQWVQDNIAAFGGDPARVTIMGESAGAGSVGLHLLSPLSGGLFSQAIMESGNALCPWAFDSNVERQIGFTTDIANSVNCTTSSNEAMMICLRDVDATDLLLAQSLLIVQNLVVDLLFTPVVDQDFLPDNPSEMVMRQEFHSVPTILGTNRDEGTLIALRRFPAYLVEENAPTMSLVEFRESLPSYLYFNTPPLVSAVEQWYVDWKQADNSSANHYDQFIELQTDQVFACATEAMARALEGTNAAVYRYEMTYVPGKSVFGDLPGWLGAGHGEEIQYVFAWGLYSAMSNFAQHSDEEKEMSVQFLRYWTNFIKNGDPNDQLQTSQYPEWPRYTLPEQEYKVLSVTMENGRALRMEKCAFWLNYAPSLYSQGPDDDIYQDWKQEYEQWRDVYMKEWNDVFDEYKENGGCSTP